MNKNTLQLLLSLSLLVPAVGAYADIDQRQINQQERIQQGVNSGRLNTKEANRLNNGQARVNQREADFRADGDLNRREKVKLNKMQNNQSKRIYRQKQDRQRVR